MTQDNTNSDLVELLKHLEVLQHGGGKCICHIDQAQPDGSIVGVERTYSAGRDAPTEQDRDLLGALYRLTILDERREYMEIDANVSLVELANELEVSLDRDQVKAWDGSLTRLMLISVADRYPSRSTRNHLIEGAVLDVADNGESINGSISFRWSPKSVVSGRELT
ncbi:hypothetical protein CCAX7_26310 [Capsulimonas corticalis]|uniref:Uncharacterized protein n=1 Tax=Capsulimonas corticalis TaxID=2219043 RepID=A0A9N7QCT9_9BACT|nr:hypothetical protein [Capsulimonas corticalis]BDI30580.1 hypothetical protein CCAX7_26310 [Capsulimonas corticalis]